MQPHQRACPSDACLPGIRLSRRKPGARNMSRRGMAARSLPPAIWYSRARPTGDSSPTTPPRARSSGRRQWALAWSRHPQPICIDGKQYVSIAVGWGGVFGIMLRATELQSPGTVYTFAVDGKAPPPTFVKYQTEGLLAGVKYDPKHVPEGTLLYVATVSFATAFPVSTRAATSGTLAMFRPR